MDKPLSGGGKKAPAAAAAPTAVAGEDDEDAKIPPTAPPPPPGYIFAGERNKVLVEEVSGPWEALDECLVMVAEHQSVYRCAFPPQGLLAGSQRTLPLFTLVSGGVCYWFSSLRVGRL